MEPRPDPERDRPERQRKPLRRAFRVGFFLYVTAFFLLIVIPILPHVSGTGTPSVQTDFLTFYAASDLALDGRLQEAFDTEVFRGLQQEFFPGAEKYPPYYYPPSFMLLVAWISTLPHDISQLIFLGVTLGFLALAARPVFPGIEERLLLIAAPPVWINVGHGQNAFLTCALALLALQWLENRQVRAGVALGFLTVKPHLGLLWPVVLILYRRWSAFGTAVATAAALVLVSIAAFGVESWTAFFGAGLSSIHDDLSAGALPISMAASPYAGMILLGFPESWAVAGHIACVLVLTGVLVHLVLIGTPYVFVMAYVFVVTLFVTPHNFTYDWLFVVVGMLLVWQQARLSGFLRFEMAGLAAGYISPLVISLSRNLELALGPPLLAVVILVVTRRAYFEACRRG